MAGCSEDRPKPRKVTLASWRMAWGNWGLVEDGVGELEDQPGEKLGQQVGEQMVPDDLEPGDAQPLGRQQIGGPAQLEDLLPDYPGQGGPVAEGDPRHHPQKAPAKGQGDEHDQQDVGDAQEQVDAPGDDSVRAPAQGGQHPQQEGEGRADAGGERPDADGQGQPRQGAGEHVPAQPVGAEQVGEAGREVQTGKVVDRRLVL